MNSLIFIWFSKWTLYPQWVWREIDNDLLIWDEIGVRDLISLIMNWLSNIIILWVFLIDDVLAARETLKATI